VLYTNNKTTLNDF